MFSKYFKLKRHNTTHITLCCRLSSLVFVLLSYNPITRAVSFIDHRVCETLVCLVKL